MFLLIGCAHDDWEPQGRRNERVRYLTALVPRGRWTVVPHFLAFRCRHRDLSDYFTLRGGAGGGAGAHSDVGAGVEYHTGRGHNLSS